MGEMTRGQHFDMLQQLTSFRPQDETAHSGASRMSLTAIRQHLEILYTDITGETDDLHIHRDTRLLLLLMFGGVLFPNTSGNLVSLRFLHHLQRLDDLPQYIWGAAVLAYLYRQICRAIMGTQHDGCAFLPLLQVWAWERFLQLQPPLPPLPLDVPPPFLPLARRWVLRRGYVHIYEAQHNLPLCRGLLDMLEGAQFICTPYNDDLIGVWITSVPLMCLDIVEHHATERVLRQFGRPQLVPRGPTWEPTHYQRDDISRVDDAYVAWLEAHVDTWDQRADMIQPLPPLHRARRILFMSICSGTSALPDFSSGIPFIELAVGRFQTPGGMRP
nr:serine/threonine-protein phosphatase 7 long form homolog isoform X2 [Nicotiana tomentosiformis]